MTILINEFIRRSDQGATRPFICRGDDGKTYFVKGCGAGRRSLVYEWIAGRLAVELGLPIAPFKIVEIPEELVTEGYNGELSDLGAGFAFGSEKQEVIELAYSSIDDVPLPQKKDVLVFDWWIKNGDRMLTEKGGNPNLFWRPGASELVVIDHNLAFDNDFDEDIFLRNHVFASAWTKLHSDMHCREEYNLRLAEVLKQWQAIADSIPKEWMFLDVELTQLAGIDLESTFQTLARVHSNDFWNTQ